MPKTSGDSAVSLFPPKPPRDKPPPGRVVKLMVNLFKLSIVQNKPIYFTTATVEKECEEKPTVPIKIRSEYRRQILDEAIKNWALKQNKSKKPVSEFTYLLDRNGSTIYSLFDFFEKSNSKSAEFRVEMKTENLSEKTIEVKKDYYKVIIFKNDKLNLQDFVDFCSGVGRNDITLFQEHIRAANVIMRGKLHTIPINLMTNTCVIPFQKDRQFKLSEGVIGNRGYFMSVRPAECGIVLNVANTHHVFHEENDLVDLLQSRYSVRDLTKPLAPELIERLKKHILNKQVEARHINYGTKAKPHYRKYRVGDIAASGLEKFTLVDKVTKEPKTVTIQEYLMKEYKWKLKYPKLPCIVDKGRKLPLEVCRLIEKQNLSRLLTPDETSTMIRFAALKPEKNFEYVKNSVDEIKRLDQPAKIFGIDFQPIPIRLDGRELEPITLIGYQRTEIRPSNGQYRPSPRDGFLKPAVVNKWFLTFLVDEEAQRNRHDDHKDGMLLEKRFMELYVNEAYTKGVKIRFNPNDVCFIRSNQTQEKLMLDLKGHFTFLNDNKYDHAIIILPSKCPDWVYGYLQFLEVCRQPTRKPGERYTRTSCVKYQNYWKKIVNDPRGGNMFLANLWLKYNTKLGGINFALKHNKNYKFLDDGYIFISLDVCHPAPGDKLSQSVAAAVGMWDLTNENMSYCTRMRVQKKMRVDHSTIEEVGEIDKMFEDILASYLAKKKKYPSKIMILRDGVSEGQFRIVLEKELKLVKSMLSRLYKKTPPQLSCLVVQKRHKVCFKRDEPVRTQKGDLDFNIQPGTVVDSVITHPKDFSFYLAPHKALQGTSRPAHIYMICDEIKFTQDEAQAMVHALSYLSPRCTKSTSIPTPVNLADLAAERGKNIVVAWNEENKRIKLEEDERLKKLNDFLTICGDKEYKNTLFYV